METSHEGAKVLHERDGKLHTTGPVEHTRGQRIQRGEKAPNEPVNKIDNWMKVLERTHGHREEPEVMERIKDWYHKQYVIKEEDIPQSYWNSQARIMIERGQGGDLQNVGIREEIITDEDGKEKKDYLFPKSMKEQQAEVLISDQESTMDAWLNYFTSPDADSYPMWAKYWAFTGMTKLSTYDKEKKEFGRRTKNTVSPFPDLNREALAYIVDAFTKKMKNEQIPEDLANEELQKLLQKADFGKIYAYIIEKITPTEENELQTTTGEWKKYTKGSDHMPLTQSLQGRATGWCTAGETTAQAQLQKGDFYVYYSHDKTGQANIPRVAIRMEENNIAEVRGIAQDQNLDPFIADVAKEKLREFPDGPKYEKKAEDMERLKEIARKHEQKKDLTKEEIKFLYEIDSPIEGFGYSKDPRILEILFERYLIQDLTFALDISEEEISTTKDEALEGGKKFHLGNLDLRELKTSEGLRLPEIVNGNIELQSLTSAEGLQLPKIVNMSLNLSSLTSAKGLQLPETVNGSLNLSSLTSAKGLQLPEIVNGNLDLCDLTSAEGLQLPETVGGRLNLCGLTSAKGLQLPETVNWNIDLSGLRTAEGLQLPEKVAENISLGFLSGNIKQALREKYPHLSIK
ncbi:MAG: hypothetical protein V1848_02480 [Candidatus Magasanikbacteria bacterium]